MRSTPGASKIWAGGPCSVDLTAFEDNDAMGDAAGEGHFVGHDNHRHPFLGELLRGVEDFADRFGVESGGGLVERHDLGFHRQSWADGDALLLAAGGWRGSWRPCRRGRPCAAGPWRGPRRRGGTGPALWTGPLMTLASAVRWGNSSKLWNTMPMRWRNGAHATWVAGKGMPSGRISPPWSDSNPLVQRSSVDLPEPEGPIRQITSRRLTSIDTPSKATKSPSSLRTSW